MRVKSIPALLLPLVATLTGCYTVTRVKPDSVLHDYAVYAAIVERTNPSVVARQGGVHRVRAHTDTLTSRRFREGAFEGDFIELAAERMELPPGLFADFRLRNRELLCLDAELFPAPARVVLIAEDSPCPGTPPASVPTAQNTFERTFSRVGFSPDGNDALVHLRHDCGDRCGGTGLVHLKRVDGRWMQHKYERISQL
ncbi:hypothetical protein BH24GEM2_BH24GEM2_19810 [soil metagenome]